MAMAARAVNFAVIAKALTQSRAFGAVVVELATIPFRLITAAISQVLTLIAELT